MTSDDHISALERLAKLRDSGALSDAEYEAQKAQILSGASPLASQPPWYRRLWVVVTLTCLLLTFPLALLILATGDVYRKADGGLQPISRGAKAVYAALLGLWLVSVGVYTAMNPNAYQESAIDGPIGASGEQANAGPQPEACNGPNTERSVRAAVENSAMSRLVQRRVLDFGNPEEIYYDPIGKARYCRADAAMNTGSTTISFKLFFGPSGSALVEVREGPDAWDAEAMKARAEVQKELDAQQLASTAGPTNPSPPPPQPPQAAGSCQLPTITKGTRYSAVRAQVLALGLKPAAPVPAEDGSYCAREANAEICRSMPEIEDCSSNGYCKMVWSGPRGEKLEITYFGDGPQDPAGTAENSEGRCE